MTKTYGSVWVIGGCDLDIVCYLLFGAWDFITGWN